MANTSFKKSSSEREAISDLTYPILLPYSLLCASSEQPTDMLYS